MGSHHFHRDRAGFRKALAGWTGVFWVWAGSALGCLRDIPELADPAEGGFVAGRVLERSLATGELAARPGVRVRVSGRSGAVTTDNDGGFRFERLPLGPLQLVAERRDASGVVRAGRYLRLLVDGQTENLDDIVISRDASIAGSVVIDEEGPAERPTGSPA